MIGIGCLHQSVCLIVPELRSGLLNIINSKNGIIGAVYDKNGTPLRDRSLSEFFLLSGNLMISCGILMRYYIKDTERPIPSSFGLFLTIICGIGCIIDPKAGYWTCLALGLYIVYKDKNHDKINEP